MHTRFAAPLGLLLAVLTLAFGCQQQGPDVEAANRQIVVDIYAAIDAHQFDQLDRYLADDMVCQMVGVPEPLNKEATIEFIKGGYAMFPDFTHELDEVLVDSNRVMLRITNHATHANEFQGIPPTGKRFQYASVHILTLEAGVISSWWMLEDNFGFMTQLGMELAPAGESKR